MAERLLCVPDLSALRQRLEHAGEGLRRRLDHVLWIARHVYEYDAYRLRHLHVVPEGLVRPLASPDETAYPALAWLLTGERVYAELTRRALLHLADSVAERERGEWTQTHTWCDAFPVGRWLIYYDWVWESGVFSAEDHAYLRERLLHYLWAHPRQRMKARPIALTPGNNQNASMSLACAAGGWLFGVKRGRDARALEMLRAALPHLVRFLTAFPRGGYSFEGSTYQGAVNAFVLPIALDVSEAITGADLFDSRHDASCASPREVLHSIMHLACPSGLTLPWDNYGYEPASFTPAAAYLAARTGDGAALALLDSFGANERPRHSGWGFDHHLWTLLYWPASLDQSACDFDFNTTIPSLGGGAAGPARRAFFYQMWDRSHWPPGRAQFNPNNLVLEFDGSPLLLDGRCVENPKAEHFALPKYQYRRPDTDSTASFGNGTVGAHNCIIIDGEEAWAPRESFEGRLLAADYQPGAALVHGDVTAGYAPHVDLTACHRATLLVGDAFVLVRDRIRAPEAHTVGWRAHLRDGDLRLDGGHARLRTVDHVWLDIIAPEADAWEHRRFEDPERESRKDGQLEGRIHELTREAHGTDHDLLTLLVPAAGLQPLRELDDAWRWQWAGDLEAAEALRGQAAGGIPIDPASGSWFYQTEEHRPGVGLYRTRFTLDTRPDGEIFLRLPHYSRTARLYVNGCCHKLELGYEEDLLMPRLVAVGGELRAGENLVELLVPSTLEHAIHGRLLLLTPRAAPPRPALTRLAADRWRVDAHGRQWSITWNDRRLRVEPPEGAAIELNPRRCPAPAESVPSAAPSTASVVETCAGLLAERAPEPRRDADAILADLRCDDWTRQLRALEDARHQPTAPVVEAVWAYFQDAMANHPTPARREREDLAWYRPKAEAARVLGEARFEPATELLGELVISNAFYPARVAAAWALARMGTPRAGEFLAQVSSHDEVNLAHTSGADRRQPS